MTIKTLGFTMAVAAAMLCVQSAAYGWYPYGERYEKWQEGRPFMMGGLHNTLPADHLAERLALFKAAGLNTLVSRRSRTTLSSGTRRRMKPASSGRPSIRRGSCRATGSSPIRPRP